MRGKLWCFGIVIAILLSVMSCSIIEEKKFEKAIIKTFTSIPHIKAHNLQGFITGKKIKTVHLLKRELLTNEKINKLTKRYYYTTGYLFVNTKWNDIDEVLFFSAILSANDGSIIETESIKVVFIASCTVDACNHKTLLDMMPSKVVIKKLKEQSPEIVIADGLPRIK